MSVAKTEATQQIEAEEREKERERAALQHTTAATIHTTTTPSYILRDIDTAEHSAPQHSTAQHSKQHRQIKAEQNDMN